MKKVLLLFLTTLTASVSFAQPACPTVQVSHTTANDVSCAGGSNGSATVNLVGGTYSGAWTYTYTWSTGAVFSGGGLSTSTISGLAVGTYTVNIKNENSGCVVVAAVVVSEPDPISISGIETDVNCYGQNTGSVLTNVTGGTPPYTYSWTGPTPSTSANLTNALAGSYTLTVTDAKNCTYARPFTIDQPVEALNSSAIVTHVDCATFTTGSIDLSVWGGTPPYAYSWNSGVYTTQDISNVSAGVYSCTVTDARGCTLNLSYNIDEPAALTGTVSTTDVICNGEATGTLTFSPSGGTPGYIYTWSNTSTLFSETGPSLVNVVADAYDVTVTDANGCQFTTSATVSEPPLLTLSTTAVNVSCYGGSDGSVDLVVSGGVSSYTYVWTNSLGANIATSEDLANVPAEVYSVLVTDYNGCTETATQEVSQPLQPITTTEVITNVLCYGESTGAVDLTVDGGTPPYTFTWTNGSSTEDINNVPAGSYGYTITDANGCTFSNSVTVTEPAQPLTVTNVITDANCFGESTGAIDLTVTGGTPGYTYNWINSTYVLSVTSEDLINFPADWYRFEVTDANGCFVVDTLTISEPPLLETSVVGVNILCKGGNNGSVDLTVTGGVTPYAYLWNTGAVTEDISTLIAGYYEVTVTDDHGCTAMDSITLTEPADSLEFTYTVEDVLCNDGTDGSIDLTVTGGTVPYDYAWSNGDTLSEIVNLTSGYYEFLVTDYNGCTITDSIFVDQPDALTLNEVITVVTCYGLSDGIIDITPAGGTMPYSYTWYNSEYALSAQTEDLINYPADMYQLEIIDSNDCFYEMFLEITQPDSLVIEYTYNVVSCAGGSDGNIFVDIFGGNPGYNTTWSNGSTTEDLTNIPADIYQLVVVDQKGCTDSIEVEIAQPDSVKIDFEVVEVSCIDQQDGIAYASPYGGNGGYYYLWSNGETSSVNEGLSNDWYYLTVTDVLGCTGSDSVFIPKNMQDCIEPVNTFTPNADLYNDTWIIDNMYLYPEANLKVFNKWGNLIHEQIGLYEPWDGTVNGVQVPSGTYYYIINLNHPDREVLTGNIIVVR